RPPGMSAFNTFFDAPAKRPHKAYKARLDLKSARVVGGGPRATIILGDLSAGPFAGTLQVTAYAGARLVHVEAVMGTKEGGVAYLYDAGLVAAAFSRLVVAWRDPEGQIRRDRAIGAPEGPIRVRHRVIAAESDGGSVASFP